MRVLITGGSGFLGQALARALQAEGHDLVIYSRRPDQQRRRSHVSAQWVGRFNDIQGPVDAVVNLAGANLFTMPWTENRKSTLRKSRVQTTEHLVTWMTGLEQKPAVFLTGSAVGFYGDQGEVELTENGEAGTDWSAKMVAAWENSAKPAEDAAIRTVYLRTGPVMGNGGMLKPLLLAFKLGLGGSLGRGDFWFSWVHEQDWVRAVLFLLNTTPLHGPFNLTAPQPVRYREFAQTLGQTLHRPVWLSPPAWALKPVLGERSELVMASTRAVPEKLQEAGFNWHYPDLKSALEAICRQ